MTLARLLNREIRSAARGEVRRVAADVRQLRRIVTQLRQAVRRQAVALRRLAVRDAQPHRRKLTLSEERRAQLKLQGQYMGYLRGLPPRKKAQVKATRASKGVLQAVRLARKLGES